MSTGTTTVTKTDSALQRAVQDELKWDPSVNAAEIGVAAKNGIVTLSGYVDSYFEKRAAERAAVRVSGVKAIDVKIEVRLPGSSQRTNADIAQAAVNALRWDISVPDNRIKAEVENGWVTLQGEVDWHYQRGAAEHAVENLTGVKGVTNLITVKPIVTPSEVKTKIENSFERQAELDARNIKVNVRGGEVTLSGTVRSWNERKEAEQVAWSTTGISEVVNNIKVHIP